MFQGFAEFTIGPRGTFRGFLRHYRCQTNPWLHAPNPSSNNQTATTPALCVAQINQHYAGKNQANT